MCAEMKPRVELQWLGVECAEAEKWDRLDCFGVVWAEAEKEKRMAEKIELIGVKGVRFFGSNQVEVLEKVTAWLRPREMETSLHAITFKLSDEDVIDEVLVFYEEG